VRSRDLGLNIILFFHEGCKIDKKNAKKGQFAVQKWVKVFKSYHTKSWRILQNEFRINHL
jgi:hypothetical protein